MDPIKVLFLDDDKNRYLSLLSKGPRLAAIVGASSADITWVQNYIEFHEVVAKETYTLVMLDHDPGPGVDGLGCARTMIELLEEVDNKPTVLVHSTNVPRAIQMGDELTDAGFKTYVMSFPRLLGSL